MPNECTIHKVILCKENKLFVKQVQATFSRQCTISDAINKIINQAIESKKSL